MNTLKNVTLISWRTCNCVLYELPKRAPAELPASLRGSKSIRIPWVPFQVIFQYVHLLKIYSSKLLNFIWIRTQKWIRFQLEPPHPGCSRTSAPPHEHVVIRFQIRNITESKWLLLWVLIRALQSILLAITSAGLHPSPYRGGRPRAQVLIPDSWFLIPEINIWHKSTRIARFKLYVCIDRQPIKAICAYMCRASPRYRVGSFLTRIKLDHCHKIFRLS